MNAKSQPTTIGWEYKTAAERERASFEQTLNDLGKTGWEVISIEFANGHHQAWLKRQVERVADAQGT